MKQITQKSVFSLSSLLMLLQVLIPLSCLSQPSSITLMAPLQPMAFPETAEFSATEAGCRWDMNQIRDIPFDINFHEISVNNGIWKGATLNNAAAISPLFRGYSTPDYEQYPAWHDKGMPYAQHNPINAGRYNRLSMRMKLPQEQRSAIFLFWTKDYRHDEYGASAGLPEPPHYMGFSDGENTLTSFLPNTSNFRIYDIDLTGKNFFAEQHTNMFDRLVHKGAWDSSIYGILMQPSMNAPPGTVVEIDWMRLYDAEAGPFLTVQWESMSDYPLEATYVRLYLDSGDQVYDGDLFISGLVNDGSYKLNTGALPPGRYYLYLELMYRGRDGNHTLARSSHSAPITILSAPTLEFTAPSMTSGDDYAATEPGIPWDMSGPACIKTNLQMTPPVFANGIMTATALSPKPPQTEADPMIFLNTSNSRGNIPINTSRYRYLTFTIKVEAAGYTNIQDWIYRGWVSRLIWGGSDYLDEDGSYTKSICLFEDWHSYSVDLWDPALLESDPALTSGWTNIGVSSFFRFDPLEVFTNTTFHLKDIKLCAMNETRDGAYNIAWRTSDPDSDILITTLYLAKTNSLGDYFEFKNPIGVVTQPANESVSFTWRPDADLPEGDYLVRAETTDGDNTFSRRTQVPIRWIPNPEPSAPEMIWAFEWGWPGAEPVPGDYDGDQHNDMAVFDQNTGYWYIITAKSKILAWALPWGWPGAEPVPGDYDGDGKSDLAVFDQNTGNWYVRTLSNEKILHWAFPWGWPGARPVPGDYDKDSKSDFCVFDTITGDWYMAPSGSDDLLWGKPWGWPGAEPVPGDYDGDGKADLAVFDQNTGCWYIITTSDNMIAWALNWGWPGAEPVPGDYDGDGKADLAVFDQNTGSWFILTTGEKVLAWAVNWGWPGARPVPGRFLNGRSDDLTVFDSNTGYWYSRPMPTP